MKKIINLLFILSVFIPVLCGCSENIEVTDNSTPPETEINHLENLQGEEFILALVDYDEADISRYFNGYPGHKGIDVISPEGKKIYAAMDGTVSRAVEMNMGYGNHLIIDHDSCRTLYAHCSQILVKEGDMVKQGDVIALVGNTGNSTGPHLHFEVIDPVTKEKVDPLTWF